MKFLNTINSNNSKLFKLLILASLYLLIIMPSLEIISSAPQDFINIWKTFGVLLYVYIFCIIFTFILFKKISLKKQNIWTFIMMFVLLYFLANYYVFSGNYGLMDYFVLHNDDVFDTSFIAILKDIFIGIFLIVLSLGILIAFKKEHIENILIFLLLIFAISSIRFAYNIYKNDKPSDNKTKIVISEKTKHNLQKEITFSKNGQNVLIIFFDRFMGGFIPDILKDNPHLKKDLKGFTWYPNTLSFGTGTAVGLAPVYGGYDFTNVDKMLKDGYKWSYRIDDTKQMKDRYETSTKFMLEKFYNHGYDVSIFDANFLSDSQLSKMSNNTFKFKDIKENKQYLNTLYYPNELSKKDNKKTPYSMIKEYMIPFSIFKVVSPSMRKSIYNNGAWYAGLSSVSINYIEVIREIAYARSWKYISDISDTSKGTFNFITSNLSHNVPVNRNINNTFQGVIPKYSLSDEKRFKDKHSASHYYLAKEALIRASLWFKWLKENGIYDNTKIIITTDHGATAAFNPMFENQKSKDGINYGSYHANLMVKDFNATNNLEINNTLMTHADTPYLALLAIDKNAHKKYGYNKEKGFRLYVDHKNENELRVFDNIFEPKNWIYKKK